MAAIVSFSVAAVSPLGTRGAIWREMKLVQRVRYASSIIGKGRLAYRNLFPQKCMAIDPFSKDYFPVFTCSAVWLL